MYVPFQSLRFTQQIVNEEILHKEGIMSQRTHSAKEKFLTLTCNNYVTGLKAQKQKIRIIGYGQGKYVKENGTNVPPKIKLVAVVPHEDVADFPTKMQPLQKAKPTKRLWSVPSELSGANLGKK